jgi:hypothetical protein
MSDDGGPQVYQGSVEVGGFDLTSITVEPHEVVAMLEAAGIDPREGLDDSREEYA